MGRIDEAMARANLDAGRGTGTEAQAPEAPPWQVDEGGSDGRPGGKGAFTEKAQVERPHEDGEQEGHPPAFRWGGFDPKALERLVASKAAGTLAVEQFRILAATLHQAQNQQHLRSVIVTSASPGDGKSHVAVNLALTLADSYRRRVLLIDADLRRPALHQVFRVPNVRGLFEALRETSDEEAAVVDISDTLALLPAGRAAANPLGGLSSDRMRQLVAVAASRFDWVIVDSPPVGVLADAHLVAETVDAALLVIRAGATGYQDVEAAVDRLGHERILGVVLNAVEPGEIRGHAYYHHYYGRDSSKG